MTRSPRLTVSGLVLSVVLGACQAASSSSTPPSPSAAASPVVSASPQATAAADTAALLAARYEQVTSGELRLEGTLLVGPVQATFSGASRSNGPDEASTLTTTVGNQESREQHVRVAGTRYVQRGAGPWLLDTSPGGATGLGGALKAALKVARDLDATTPGAGNHRVEAADLPFDAVSLGFASTASAGRATYTFIAKPDGTPVSVSVAATWTQPGDGAAVDVRLDLRLTFAGLNTKPRIAAPTRVWQSFVSERWGYSVAYPNDFDFSKNKDADVFFGPADEAASVDREETGGYTLNQLAAAQLAVTDRAFKAKAGTNDAIIVGGVKARFLTTSGTSDGQKVIIYQALAVRGKYIYGIVWIAPAADDVAQREAFRQMVATFQFT